MWESNEDGIADLRVEALLGSGDTADVFRVCAAGGERFAWKVLRSVDSQHVSRFMREGAAPRDVRHPNVVGVRGEATIGAKRGLLLDLVEGPTLEEAIARGAMSEARVDHIARGLIRGVAAIHAQGLVHRDLTSNNVVLDANFEPHIIDFGLVKALGPSARTDDPEITAVRTMLGSAQYVPPEQARDAADVDQRADIYALGVLLYELVCGERPFEGSFVEILVRSAAGEFDPPSLVQPGVPTRWERAILGAIRPDREDRWPDCAALMAAWTGVPLDVGPDAPECVVPVGAIRGALRSTAAWPRAATLSNRLDVLVDHHAQGGAVGLNQMFQPVPLRTVATARAATPAVRPVTAREEVAEAPIAPTPIVLPLDRAVEIPDAAPIELPVTQAVHLSLPVELPVELPSEARLPEAAPLDLRPDQEIDALAPPLLPDAPEPTLVALPLVSRRLPTPPPVPTWMTTTQPAAFAPRSDGPDSTAGSLDAAAPSRAATRLVRPMLPLVVGLFTGLVLLGALMMLSG